MDERDSMKVVGLGAGGHAKVIIEMLRLAGEYEIAGLLDSREELRGRSVLGVPVLGGDEKLLELWDQGIRHVFIGVGPVARPGVRAVLFDKAVQFGFEVINAIHPRAIVSPSAQVGRGLTMMTAAVMNASVLVGDNVIIGTGAIVEHDCMLGNHVHVDTGAILAAGVRVGHGAHIGAGATVCQGVKIGRNVAIAAGSAVIGNVPDTVVGCREQSRHA